MPSFPSRAMRGLSDVGDVRRAIGTRRVMHDRDDGRASRASALYEELRLLRKDDLYRRAGVTSPRGHPRGAYSTYSRQQLIADIVEREVQPTTEDVGKRTKEMGPSGSS